MSITSMSLNEEQGLHHRPLIRLALSPEEAAEALGVSKRTIYAMIKRKQIHHLRIKARGKKGQGKIIIPVAALEKWLNADRTTAPAKPKKRILSK